ncbi:MAG: family 10 glycosylhydrolase [Phycisphaerae bacterium]|nr:family 10 glycosylhydrolase [Phycisphaerae bacterium]
MWACLFLAALSAGMEPSPVTSAEVPAEFRAAWVSRFEWTSRDPEECRAKIVDVFQTLAEANFNAAVFQVRGEAETLYPSDLEPWSVLFEGQDPGFDPVAFALEHAHECGIAFHAYINPMPLRSVRRPDIPEDPQHLFYRHGPVASQPWVCVDAEGRPAREGYYYLSPGIPGVHAYVRNVIMDFVQRYDVDGIHLDRIRYPGADYSHDLVSRRRFMERGNPNLLEWSDWQREQLDKFVNDLAAEIWSEKPEIMMSCAAWGIYNRYHIDGYGGFSSGFHDYGQDTWNWCRLGAMDVLMPMIYWDLADPKPNYDELMEDFIRGVGPEHFVGGQNVFNPDENLQQIRLTREAGALGTVLWNFRSAQQRGVIARAHEELYQESAPVPVPARVTDPQYGIILGTVLADDGEPLEDAWVSLEPVDEDARRRGVFRQTWTSSADGRFAFLNVSPGPARCRVEYVGAPAVTTEPVDVQVGQTSRIRVTVPESGEARRQPFLAILQPPDGFRTTRPVAHLLGRARLGHRVTVNGEDVEVYSTGGFAKDGIPLELGENRIEITVAERRRTHTRVITVTRIEPEPAEAVTALRFLQPAEDATVQPGQLLEVRLEGPPGRTGTVSVFDGRFQLPLAEEVDAEGKSGGTYSAVMRVPESMIGKQTGVQVELARGEQAPALKGDAPGSVDVWDPAQVRVAETTSDQTGITYGLHRVRLGGPWMAWVPRGTRFEVVGRRGENCKVRLSASMTGWVSQDDIRWLPPGTAVPHNFFTSCGVDARGDHDVLSIGTSAPVVVAVRPAIDPTNRLYVDFFNTHDATTWITQKCGAKVIGPVQTEQMEEDWLRLTVPLNCKQNWGYWTEMRDGRFTLHVRRPPTIAAFPDSPLDGLTIALEAGHGGTGSGAVGHFGTKEKTVNWEAAKALQRELESRGARVVQVRRGDEAPTLQERAERANKANADFYVSIHANAAGSAGGFLRTSGTSTYYHGIHCQRPARLVYEKLLGLGWDEFGVVGNFSYMPLRNTRVPAILIEQAFMSHPGDEARLLDPDYHRQQAIAVADALDAFFDGARE